MFGGYDTPDAFQPPYDLIGNSYSYPNYNYCTNGAAVKCETELCQQPPYCYSADQYYHHHAYPPAPLEQYTTDPATHPPVSYEYQEPEENFISVDDLQYKPELLQRILSDSNAPSVKKEHDDLKEFKQKLSQNANEPIGSNAMEANYSITEYSTAQDDVIKAVKDILTQTIVKTDTSQPSTSVTDALSFVEVKLEGSDELEPDDGEVQYLITEFDEDDIDENEVGIELDWTELTNNRHKTRRPKMSCPICFKKFASSYNLQRHLTIHTGIRLYGCDICLKSFREFSDLKKHRRSHAGHENFKCLICRDNTPSELDATRCDECCQDDEKQTHPYGDKTLEHILPVENGPDRTVFVCPDCNRIFNTRHNLRRHYMIHTGEKPYQCELCDKVFREAATLRKHMLTHSRLRRFKCLICKRSYNDFPTYIRHRDTHKEHIGEFDVMQRFKREKWKGQIFKFQCNYCPKIFVDAKSYKGHLKVHSYNRKVYRCDICKQSFKKPEKLNSHFVTHKLLIEN